MRMVWVLIGVVCVWVAARYGLVPPKLKSWFILRTLGRGALEPPNPKLLPNDVILDKQLSSEDDVDLFEYREIADRVAELLAGSVHPVHIGVFGAWGAGKSSFLTLVQQRLTALAGAPLRPQAAPTPQFRVVRYDAWRYGGQALRRDLIAVAAKELKVRRRKYRSGLFESRQVVRLEMNEFIKRIWSFLLGVVVLFSGLAAVVGLGLLGLLIASSIWDAVKTPGELISDLSVNWGKVAAWLSAGLAVLSAPNLLGVTVNRSSPSQDDEFARNLKSLIREAELVRPLRSMAKWTWLVKRLPVWCRRRVVFFIDELDRASDTEVLNTLIALQTQFADANVSVIVAADRDVIEKALDNRDTQRRPERTWDPYLSSSDSFLDKVFQHTFVLPPLRTERITEFARQQVSKDNGLWRQIDREGLTDDVLYALIPSHVHSPRRIKVLLNAYATQSRVAEARHLPVATIRLQLAMWVVLQLEFPRFAADLKVEQTLRRVMLDEKRELSGKLNRMYATHRPVDEPDPEATDAQWREWSYRNQLQEYLEATESFADIPFDLLFLETAGSAIGRFSEEVATALDRADRLDPARVLTAVGDLDEETLDRAIQFVADRSRIAISIGRDRAIRVMAGLIDQHSPAPLGRVSSAALDAFRRYTPLRPPPADAVIAQIRIYLEAAPTDVSQLLMNTAKRADAPHVAVIARDLVVPAETDANALDQLTGWLVDHMSPFVLSGLAASGKTGLLEQCIGRGTDGVLAALLDIEEENDTEAEEEPEEETAAVVATPTTTVAEVVEDEEEPEPDPDVALLTAEQVTELIAALSPDSAAILINETVTHLRDGHGTPDLVNDLLESQASADLKGDLAAAAIISDPDLDDLDTWVGFATDCPDPAVQGEVADALVSRLTPATSVDLLAATFQHATLLTNDGNREAIAESATATLTNAPWVAGEEPARAAFSAAIINWMAEDKLPGHRELALTEARAKIPHAVSGAIPLTTLTQNLGHLETEQLKELELALTLAASNQAEPIPSNRILTVRLALRRRFPDILEVIKPATVAATYNASFGNTDPESIGSRNALMDEWFAIPKKDRDVVYMMRNAKYTFTKQLLNWMPTVTAVQATNAWVQASKNWNDEALSKVTKAVQLDTSKVVQRMGEMAASNDVDQRKKALDQARMFPKGRADSERAVQEVARHLATRSADERRQGLRLLADYEPKRLQPSIRQFIEDVPKSFLRSSAAKALWKRVTKG